MDAVRLLDVGQARVNERGTGSPQYPPTRMLGLLIDSYATGTFSSRQIERAIHENVTVRLLCADRHPVHDSICTFCRTNGALLQSGFGQVLAMAAQMRVLNVGQVTLAIDGAKILANASKHSAVSHGHATEQTGKKPRKRAPKPPEKRYDPAKCRRALRRRGSTPRIARRGIVPRSAWDVNAWPLNAPSPG